MNWSCRLLICFGLTCLALTGLILWFRATLNLHPMAWLFSATCATICFAALKIPRPWQQCFLISAITVAVTLWAAEIYYQFTKAQDPLLVAATAHGVEFDERSPLEVILDLRKTGVMAYPPVDPKSMAKITSSGERIEAVSISGEKIVPLGTVSNSTIVGCNENGEFLIYRSDRHGFHNPGEAWQTTPTIISAVGDSFTQGSCVKPNEGMVAVIQKEVAGTLNFGMPGAGPLSALAALKEYAEKYQPRIVLWFYYDVNDISKDLKIEKKIPTLMKYLRTSFRHNLIQKQAVLDEQLRAYFDKGISERQKKLDGGILSTEQKTVLWKERIADFLFLRTLRTVFRISARNLTSSRAAPELELMEAVLSEAKQTVEAWGGEIYVVYLPGWYWFAERSVSRWNPSLNISNPTNFDWSRPQFLALIEELKIPLIDLLPVFKAQSDPLAYFPFRQYGHYNAAGHKFVADEILRKLPLDKLR